MSLEGVPMNIFTISKWRPFSKWPPPQISYWEYLGRFLFSEPIILCNSTFLGFLRSRKPNLIFSNSKWPPILKWRPFFQNGDYFSIKFWIFFTFCHQIVQRVGCISFCTVHYSLPKVLGI